MLTGYDKEAQANRESLHSTFRSSGCSLESLTKDGEEFTLRGFTDNRQGAGPCRAVQGRAGPWCRSKLSKRPKKDQSFVDDFADGKIRMIPALGVLQRMLEAY